MASMFKPKMPVIPNKNIVGPPPALPGKGVDIIPPSPDSLKNQMLGAKAGTSQFLIPLLNLP